MAVETVNNLAPNKVSSDVVPIELIRPSSLNPRKHFDEAQLAELAASLKAHGLLEPIVVRSTSRSPADNGSWLPPYEIIAGERRFRAAKIAGLTSLPIRNLGVIDDRTALELALVENLQRADLDPIEEAQGYRALNEVAGLKQAAIAAAVHRSQPVIANRIRLLGLPDDVQESIRSGVLSASHGVALARFAEFPAVASALGKLAIEKKATTGELEDSSVPLSNYLEHTGAIRGLHPNDFDTNVCKTACPFGAYRSTGSYWTYCLRPDHYDELTAAANTARTAEMIANEEIRRAELAQKNPDLVAKMAPIPETVPTMDRYQSGMEDYPAKPPPGCSKECYCFGQALHWGHLVDVCKDPPRLKKLQRAQAIATNRTRRKDAKLLGERLSEKIDGLASIGEKELVLLAARANRPDYSYPKADGAWHDAYQRQKGNPKDPRNLIDALACPRQQIDSLVAYGDALAAVKLAIEAICLVELEQYHEFASDAPMTRWYLGEGTEATHA